MGIYEDVARCLQCGGALTNGMRSIKGVLHCAGCADAYYLVRAEASFLEEMRRATMSIRDVAHGNTFYTVPRPTSRSDAFDGDSESREYTEVRS